MTSIFQELQIAADLSAEAVGVQDVASTASQKGMVVLAYRHDADSIAVADGDLALFQLDEKGRLKVASTAAAFALQTMSVSAIQAAANTPVASATAFAAVNRASNVTLYVTGTFAGMNCTFEASLDSTNGTDGTWWTVDAKRSGAATVETTTGVLAASPAYSWEISVNGYNWVRVRCTARTSGTQVWQMQLGTYATEPAPVAQPTGTQAISGSLTSAGTTTATPATGTTYNLETSSTAIVAAFMKSSAGSLYEITVSNPTATAMYVKLYNKASAPVAASDVPVVTIPVPANSSAVQQYGVVGKRFATGIAIGVTGAIGKTDTTIIAIGLQINATYI